MEEEQTHILVVDDEEDLCEILKFNLETDGYRVDTANSAEVALEMDVDIRRALENRSAPACYFTAAVDEILIPHPEQRANFHIFL